MNIITIERIYYYIGAYYEKVKRYSSNKKKLISTEKLENIYKESRRSGSGNYMRKYIKYFFLTKKSFLNKLSM